MGIIASSHPLPPINLEAHAEADSQAVRQFAVIVVATGVERFQEVGLVAEGDHDAETRRDVRLDADAWRDIQIEIRVLAGQGILLVGVHLVLPSHHESADAQIDEGREPPVEEEAMRAEKDGDGGEVVPPVVAVSDAAAYAEVLVDEPFVQVTRGDAPVAIPAQPLPEGKVDDIQTSLSRVEGDLRPCE